MYFQPQDNVGHICMYTVHHELATSIFPLLGNATTVCVCVCVCVCAFVLVHACVCVCGWVGGSVQHSMQEVHAYTYTYTTTHSYLGSQVCCVYMHM